MVDKTSLGGQDNYIPKAYLELLYPIQLQSINISAVIILHIWTSLFQNFLFLM